MGRIFVVLVAIQVLAGFTASSQHIDFGITGGGNMSTLNMENARYRPGFQAGGYGDFVFSRRFGIQTELIYSRQRAELMDQTYTLDYFQVPIMAKIYLNKYINIQFGPQYGMFVSSSGTFEELQTPVRSKSLSFAMGLGVELPMGFSANLRFANALDESFQSVGEVTSDVVQLSVGADLISLRSRKR